MLRCLIVDDSPRFLIAARGLLEREGVSVVGTALTATQAAQLVDQTHPDVVLVDIDLGGESGFDVIRRLQHGDKLSLPAILISTHAEQDYADLIDDSPALGFMAKTELSAHAIEALLHR